MRARHAGTASEESSEQSACLDNRLAFFDQATFLTLRATGREQLMQIVWIYEHPIDMDKMMAAFRNAGYGLMGRRIERSPLPFGRHRWVSAVGQPLEIDIAESARPRAELSDWLDERAQLTVDPESGPGWHAGLLPMTDGSTAGTVVMSHCLADGVAGLFLVFDAITGTTRDLGYPPPRSRTRLQAVVSDLRETVQGLPEAYRAFCEVAKLVSNARREAAQSPAPRTAPVPETGADAVVIVPTVSIYVDLSEWDARAKALNGDSGSLLAGFAAKLGEHMGRQRPDDGTIALLIPYSDRTMDDTRAIAMRYAKVSVDPTRLTTDLSGPQVTIKEAVKAARETPDPALPLLPLTPFIPKRVVTRLADMLFGFGDGAVLCSDLGHLPVALARPDGTAAEYVNLRGVDQNVTRGYIERAGGQLVVVGGRLNGKMSMSVVGYRPGGSNTKQDLRELVARTLAEFGVSAKVD
ncbi:hypothetical protein [Mycobacterium conspicuum]|uniref:hypothetical protein n=1 Tax=Mycobacterium conspicuum TaxID=44010 RepID=UPI000A15DD0E|nr:hypothetical protein [Mycobacterium conspicuum]ORV42595.1 hypothetical protein AWC00_11585 [Mycobacterium conspicuum]